MIESCCNCRKSKELKGLSESKCRNFNKYVIVSTRDDDLCIHCGHVTVAMDPTKLNSKKRVDPVIKNDDSWLNGGFE